MIIFVSRITTTRVEASKTNFLNPNLNLRAFYLFCLSWDLFYIMSKETVMSAIREQLEEYASNALIAELDRLDEEKRSIPIVRTRSRTATERIRDSRIHREKVDHIVSLELKVKSDFRKYISDLKECKNVWSGYPKFGIK